MVKRYNGNSGQVTWIEDRPSAPPPPRQPPPPPRQPLPPEPVPSARPAPQTSRSGQSQRNLLSFLPRLEQEDLLMLLIFYFLYRESGDTELLIMIAALLFS